MKTTLEELKIAVDKAYEKYQHDTDVDIQDFYSQGGPLRLVVGEEWPYNLIFNDDEVYEENK